MQIEFIRNIVGISNTLTWKLKIIQLSNPIVAMIGYMELRARIIEAIFHYPTTWLKFDNNQCQNHRIESRFPAHIEGRVRDILCIRVSLSLSFSILSLSLSRLGLEWARIGALCVCRWGIEALSVVNTRVIIVAGHLGPQAHVTSGHWPFNRRRSKATANKLFRNNGDISLGHSAENPRRGGSSACR